MRFHAGGFAVDLDHSGLGGFDESEDAADVFGKDGGAQTVGDVVGNLKGLIQIPRRDDAENRTKYLALSEFGARVHFAKNRRFDEISRSIFGLFPPSQEAIAFLGESS